MIHSGLSHWRDRQIWPWNTEWSRAKVNRVLPREHSGHSKHPLPTTQEKTLHMDITGWSTLTSDWLSSLQPKMEKLYTISKNKTECWLWVRTWTPYCQIRLDLKRVGKTTRPFRYDLNQIPCNYTVEVTNRFKVLDLIDGHRFVIFYRRPWSRPSQEKEMQKGKMVIWGGLPNSWEKKIS